MVTVHPGVLERQTVSTTRDHVPVGDADEQVLLRFVKARRDGDEQAARRWWDELIRVSFDRISGMARAYSSGHLSRDQQDEAIQRALIKISNNMIHSFRGASIGEWVAAVRTLVQFMCMDVKRDAVAVAKHEASLQEAAGDDPDLGRWDSEVYAAIEKRRGELASIEADQEAIREGQAFLDWAVPRLSQRRRAVIELDRQNVAVEEIQARLGISRDVVYAARSRALKDLAKLRQEYER
jgi:capsule polysaccharide export protein KpsE/RkpR